MRQICDEKDALKKEDGAHKRKGVTKTKKTRMKRV